METDLQNAFLDEGEVNGEEEAHDEEPVAVEVLRGSGASAASAGLEMCIRDRRGPGHRHDARDGGQDHRPVQEGQKREDGRRDVSLPDQWELALSCSHFFE